MSQAEMDQRIERVRRFNRFYTRQIGVLREGLLNSPFSLTEARVLYELAHHEETTATQLGAELGIDGGYLSRILRRLGQRGLVDRRRSLRDGRQSLLQLTEEGKTAFARLNAASRHEIGEMLGRLESDQQRRLVEAMQTIEDVLHAQPEPRSPYILRPPEPGDLGWVIQRHGALYNSEYGWDWTFEALVAEIVAKFIQHYNPKRERCWIAEKEGENVGSVFLVEQSEQVAKLRLLLVEPRVRGLGIGGRLVDECIRFARRCGYTKITLWTNDVLHAARRIYQRAGFTLVHAEPHHSFGHDLVGETWELAL